MIFAEWQIADEKGVAEELLKKSEKWRTYMDDRQMVALGLDKRLLKSCIYCGGSPDTRDHVPSKVFLDKPYPDNLPVVACCLDCNRSFSLDEEYVACFIECVIAGSTSPDAIQRERISRKLSMNLTQVRESKS